MRLILLIVAIATVMVTVMSASYMHGRKAEVQSEESRISAVTSEATEETGRTPEHEKNSVTNDECLGKVTGEDDDFTLTVDPANFDVAIKNYDTGCPSVFSIRLMIFMSVFLFILRIQHYIQK